ncbi:MAG: polysaccharide pyruvyl transferase family protein [Planctomycetes bacterium]|nr:polysaccharide pyruvyl transferase family protein [Planctomycetota bacterium]
MPKEAEDSLSTGDFRGMKRIAVWGLFGQMNLGNECTAEALLANLKRLVPSADVLMICSDPGDAGVRHEIPAQSIFASYSGDERSRNRSRSKRLLARLLRAVFRGIPREVESWWRTLGALKDVDLLAMAGTGMLTDWGTSARSYPYAIFKWTLCGRLRGCKVRFLSVGVGPLRQRMSRFFIKASLSLADYCSYRDEESKILMGQHGYDTSKQHVFPDLAFSLPVRLFQLSSGRDANDSGHKAVVGVGVMDYYGRFGIKKNNESIYERYMAKTSDFVAWFVENGYRVRVLQGDMRYDTKPRADLKSRLEKRGITYGESIVDDDVTGVGDLLAQIEQTDVVISPRFHNLLLSIMYSKPVISISYDTKCDSLMEGVGFAKYCQRIEELDVERLIKQFRELERNIENLRSASAQCSAEYRKLLDEQYGLVLSGR